MIYLSARKPAAARNVTNSIRQTITGLVLFPRLGKFTDEWDVRVLIEPEYFYRVFYRIDGDVVTVIRVLHGSQRRGLRQGPSPEWAETAQRVPVSEAN